MSRYHGSSICKETRSPPKHSHIVWNHFYNSNIYKLQQRLRRLWSFKNVNLQDQQNLIPQYVSIQKNTTQYMFTLSNEIFYWSDQIFEGTIYRYYPQHKELKNFGYELINLILDTPYTESPTITKTPTQFMPKY